MAESFWGGLATGLEAGQEAAAARRDSSLKQKIMEMQMMEYQAKQQQAQAQQALAGEYEAAVASGDPARVNAVARKGAMLSGDYGTLLKGQGINRDTMAMLKEFGVFGGGGGEGGAGGGIEGQTRMVPSVNAEGQLSLGGHYESPPAELKVAQAFLLSKGIQPGTPEWEEKLGAYLYGKTGGRGGEEVMADLYGQPRQMPQQPQQGRMPPQQMQQPQEEGIEAVGPDGKPMYFDQRSTYEEALQRGIIPPQGQAVPQYAGGGGNPLDRANARELRQKEAEAAATAYATEQNKAIGEGERKTVSSLKASVDLVNRMLSSPVKSATGPMEGSAIGKYVGKKAPRGMGGNTSQQTKYLVDLAEVGSVIGLARGGQTFTPQEQARLDAIVPTSDLSDEVIADRLSEVKEIFGAALERETSMIQGTRSSLREDLQRGTIPARKESAPRGGQQQAGGAQEGAIVRNPKTGARLRLQGGRWTPVGPE